jgi:hypothetical protein
LKIKPFLASFATILAFFALLKICRNVKNAKGYVKDAKFSDFQFLIRIINPSVSLCLCGKNYFSAGLSSV